MSKMTQKKIITTPVKVRRRRPSSELARPYMCNQPECERRYEEFRTLQQHLQSKHGIRVSLRNKAQDCSVFDVRKSHRGESAPPASPPPHDVISPESPAPVTADPASHDVTSPADPASHDVISPESSPPPPPVRGYRESEEEMMLLEDIDMMLLDAFFLNTPGLSPLPYTEDEIVSMYAQCLKEEAAVACAPVSATPTPAPVDIVPDHNGNYDHHAM